jgi:Fe2+ transport system protein FeoA
MCLSEIKKGQEVNILEIRDDELRTQLIRFGIGVGSLLTCMEKIPFGPFMLKHNRQEIALGRKVAERIVVQGGSIR